MNLGIFLDRYNIVCRLGFMSTIYEKKADVKNKAWKKTQLMRGLQIRSTGNGKVD